MEFRWLEPLYIKNIPDQNVKQIRQNMDQGHFSTGVWAIVLPFGGSNLLEIYPVYAFSHKNFPYSHADVLGLAANRKEAKELVVSLVQETLLATGGMAVKDYYREKIQRTGSGPAGRMG